MIPNPSAMPPAPWHPPTDGPWTDTRPGPFCLTCETYRVQKAGDTCPACLEDAKEDEQ